MASPAAKIPGIFVSSARYLYRAARVPKAHPAVPQMHPNAAKYVAAGFTAAQRLDLGKSIEARRRPLSRRYSPPGAKPARNPLRKRSKTPAAGGLVQHRHAAT